MPISVCVCVLFACLFGFFFFKFNPELINEFFSIRLIPDYFSLGFNALDAIETYG